MTDIPVKCTRCRNHCKESEWLNTPSKKCGGWTEKTCPRCGCKSYYNMTPQVAWCWASGLIEIGDKAPCNGEIVIAEGPKYALKNAISVAARHGYGTGEGQLLVPGIPEAANQKEAGNALDKWLKWNRKCQLGRRAGIAWTNPKDMAGEQS